MPPPVKPVVIGESGLPFGLNLVACPSHSESLPCHPTVKLSPTQRLPSLSNPNVPWRKVPRDVNEEARDQARALMVTPEFERSRDERKRVEMRFAHLKTHHRFDRMRLRGLTGA